jgi:lipopolysaccharide exporter
LKKYTSSYWIRSAFFAFLQRFSLTFFGFVNFIVLIRTLSKPEMGVWALFLAITTIFEITKTNLLKNAHVKYVSASDNNSEKITLASSSLSINAGLTLIFIIFILFFSHWLSDWLHAGAELSVMLVWFIPALIFMVFFSHFEAIQQSHLDFKGGFAGYFVRQGVFFTIILTHYLLHIPFTLKHLALYLSLSVFLGALVLFLYTRKSLKKY